MIHSMSLDLEEKLRSRGFPLRVRYGPERVSREGYKTVIVMARDHESGDSIGAPKGNQRNPRYRFARRLGCVAEIFAASTKPGAAVHDHEGLCDAITDAFLVALYEWGAEAKVGNIDITSSKYLTKAERNDIERWPGLVYQVRFNVARGVYQLDFEGGAQLEGSYTKVANETNTFDPFNPDQISGLIGRWRGQDVVLNGANVSSATDISDSGTEFPMAQSDPSKQPVLNVDDPDFGGKSSIEFDGVSELLFNSTLITPESISIFANGEDRPFTVILVAKRITGVNSSTFWSWGGTNGDLIRAITTGTDGVNELYQKSPPSILASAGPLPLVSDPPRMLSWADSGTERIFRVNNILIGGAGQDFDADAITINHCTFGATKSSVEFGHMAYKFSEALIYDRQLTADEITKIYSFERNEYSL